jgi:hypothetical protein
LSRALRRARACRSIIPFFVGGEDAPYLEREFAGKFEYIDLMQLPNYRICLKLMIDGMPSKPFSATTFLPETRLIRALSGAITV